MNFDEIYEKLIILEEEIANCYIALAEIEMGINEEADYDYYFKLLCDDLNKEKDYFNKISLGGYLSIFRDRVNHELIGVKEFDITLGRHTKGIFFRLKYILEYSSGGEILEYASILRSDANKIRIMMLDNLKDNPKYESIKNDLIASEYNMYFLNIDNEYDYVNDLEKDLVLRAGSSRTSDFLGYKYIDRGILLFEAETALTYIMTYGTQDFKENSNLFTSIVLKILIILSNLTLCEEDNLGSIYEEIVGILEDSSSNEQLKEVLEDALNILNELQNEIRYERNL